MRVGSNPATEGGTIAVDGLPPAMSATPADDLVIARTFDAPPAVIYGAWTEPRQVLDWWRPAGYAVQCDEMEVRPGGVVRMRMRYEDGTLYASRIAYRETVAPSRLVYHEMCEEDGRPFHSATVTITFAEQEGGTLLTIRARFDWIAERNPRWTPDLMMRGWMSGWNDTLELLRAYLLANPGNGAVAAPNRSSTNQHSETAS